MLSAWPEFTMEEIGHNIKDLQQQVPTVTPSAFYETDLPIRLDDLVVEVKGG